MELNRRSRAGLTERIEDELDGIRELQERAEQNRAVAECIYREMAAKLMQVHGLVRTLGRRQ